MPPPQRGLSEPGYFVSDKALCTPVELKADGVDGEFEAVFGALDQVDKNDDAAEGPASSVARISLPIRRQPSFQIIRTSGRNPIGPVAPVTRCKLPRRVPCGGASN